MFNVADLTVTSLNATPDGVTENHLSVMLSWSVSMAKNAFAAV